MEEITIRDARVEDAPALARVHVDTWRTTYDGIVADDYLAGLSYEKCEDGWAKQLAGEAREGSVLVADHSEKGIVGFASAGKERGDRPAFDAEVYAIYILDSFQHQGLGAQLLRAMAERLASQGLNSMLVWVLAANPSRAFYKSLAGVRVAEKEIEIGGRSHMEVAYGWDAIHTQRMIRLLKGKITWDGDLHEMRED
jgi:L-amino acid N-acyltransferase YncA